VTIVDVKKGKQQVLTKQQLENYCRDRRHSPLEK
jgi:hypothetical protein